MGKGREKLSLYQQHKARWKEGCGSRLCDRALNIVFGRGTIPADVVFVGEAPGESEDSLGKPFIGPAGKLLDSIIYQAGLENSDGVVIRYAITNLVGCIPRDEDGQGKATEPDDDCVIQCKPKLEEFIQIANPKLIVEVGKLAHEWLDPSYKHGVKVHKVIPRIHITHPAAILRANVMQQDLAIRRCVIQIRNAVLEHITNGTNADT